MSVPFKRQFNNASTGSFDGVMNLESLPISFKISYGNDKIKTFIQAARDMNISFQARDFDNNANIRNTGYVGVGLTYSINKSVFD